MSSSSSESSSQGSSSSSGVSRSSGQSSSSASSRGSSLSSRPSSSSFISSSSSSSGEPVLAIDYIGGTSATNGLLEDYVPLRTMLFIKGYMLRFTCPPIQPGTPVTWHVIRARDGLETGSYYQDGAWASYETPVPKPVTRSVFWRSDLNAPGDGELYSIDCTYTPLGGGNPVTPRVMWIQSVELDPTVAAYANQFTPAGDMAQRTMIQLFYLNKGRLSQYRIGQYDEAAPEVPPGAHEYYRSDRQPPKNQLWSCVADEVHNFDQFALNTAAPSSVLSLATLVGIWTEFKDILAAPLPNEVTKAAAGYANWLAAAAMIYTLPANFAATRPRRSAPRFRRRAAGTATTGSTPWQSATCRSGRTWPARRRTCTRTGASGSGRFNRTTAGRETYTFPTRTC